MRLLPGLIVAAVLAACSSPASGVADAPPGPTDAPASASASPSTSEVPSTPPTPVAPSPTPVIGAFDGERAVAFARDLADRVGPRLAGTEADAQAQVLIADAFRAAGWSLTTQEVPLPQGGATQNLIAWQGPAPEGPFVVVGGHHDTVGGAPGANDNASGVGVLIALAQELRDEELAVPVALIAFGAEEFQPGTRKHHVGSDVHAGAYGDRVIAALSVDMIANGNDTCICWLGTGPRTLVDRLQSVAGAAGLEGPFIARAAGDVSDHGPYALRGIPAAFLWSGKDGNYHSPRDTSEHLQVDDVQRAGELALAFIRSLRPDDEQGLQEG